MLETDVEDKEECIDIQLNIYGTTGNPIFLAGDIGRLCGLHEKYVPEKIKAYKGNSFIFQNYIVKYLCEDIHNVYKNMIVI
jgi:hypothetical protein